MGIYIHSYVSLYSFIMGVLWFNVFVLLGLLTRKLKFPIKFSVVPLLLLLVLSVLRMFIAIEFPGTIIILSETIYPAIVSLLRYEIISHHVFGIPINVVNMFILIWIAVAVYLISKYLYLYIGRHSSIIYLFERCERDEHAESLLAEMIGTDKYFRVYRNGCFRTAAATAVKPYIILPKFEFPPNELKAILLHEWKHIQDKDYLTELIVNIISFVFWWNPLAYILRKNFYFVQELKCDRFAVSKNKSFKHFLSALLMLDKVEKENDTKRMKHDGVNTLVSSGDELVDRLNVLALRGESRSRRILTNACYSIVIFALFIASYTFTILPIFWDSPYIPESTETLEEMFVEHWSVFIPTEAFIVDNGDGTFSLFIDGQYIESRSSVGESWEFIPIRKREHD